MKPISANELLKDAEALANGFTSEARRRSAVSRAYYAAYHRCLAWISLLPNCPQPPTCGSVHAWLIHHLRYPDPLWDEGVAKRSRALGQLMLEQRDRRVHADYDLKEPVDQKVMSEQIAGVRRTFAACAHPDT
ncbi:hypothetical protein [Mitsuaria sp. 7]|uniref:hypothetical protein n=1 Tax=Mitsuaria sp. 7 TaxID=1658665 RepID=UPI0012FA0F97|nr:hypothetical protein [Mitsuaria sp. 7]